MRIINFLDSFRKKKPEQKIVVKTPYARAGETITCTNGHPIADFVRTVYLGDMQDVENDLGNWRQEKPSVGQMPLPVCAQCGAQFTGGSIYHFENGWRGLSWDHS